MNTNAHGCAEQAWDIGAANEEFPDVDAELDAHVYVHAGWDPYAAWRARVKATFSLPAPGPAELLT
jgi:hypothetical protein